MTSRTLHTVAVTGALALLLTACSPDSPTPSTSPTPAASQTSTSASPTPTSTLTPAEQEAFEQATSVAVAFKQTDRRPLHRRPDGRERPQRCRGRR